MTPGSTFCHPLLPIFLSLHTASHHLDGFHATPLREFRPAPVVHSTLLPQLCSSQMLSGLSVFPTFSFLGATVPSPHPRPHSCYQHLTSHLSHFPSCLFSIDTAKHFFHSMYNYYFSEFLFVFVIIGEQQQSLEESGCWVKTP